MTCPRVHLIASYEKNRGHYTMSAEKVRQCQLDALLAFPSEQEEEVESPDVHFEPIVQLPAVEYKPSEENEEEVFKM